MTAARPATPAIEITDLSVHYGGIQALTEVNLSVAPGRVCALLGVNGSGKSTLLQSIIGEANPTSGVITIAGHGIKEAKKRSLVSYVPQSERVDWAFPIVVHDVVMMGLYGRMGWSRRPQRHHRTAVEQALERVGLTDVADRQIGELSGGQRKRVFVARALVHDAAVMLLDEPFAGVDRTSEAVLTQVLREQADLGRTVLVAVHDLSSLASLCTEAILLHRTVLLHGALDHVLQPENLALAFGTRPSHPALKETS